jgi:hypothetical protein
MRAKTMSTATTTTFEISNVNPATEPLPEVPYKDAVEALLSTGMLPHERQLIEGLRSRGRSVPFPELSQSNPVEACTRYHGRLLANVSFHPVVAAIHHAFMDHRPLCLSPDTIWLMIIQGVANHINANAEEVRPRIVEHRGKVEIEVRRDDFLKGSPENPWAEVFNKFSAQIRDHVGASIEQFIPKFSTTGPVERAAAEVVLLDAMQSYFKFVLRSRCGIPTIALEGTQEDWKTLAERMQYFRSLGLEPWVNVLVPILDQFARAAQGDVDQAFWQSLYKLENQSGGPVITGWITAFFPYLKDGQTGRATVPASPLFDRESGYLDEMLHPDDERKREWAEGPTLEKFPSGLSKAPFLWSYLAQSFDMEFPGGFVGVNQDQETLTLRPEIGWAVREAPGDR